MTPLAYLRGLNPQLPRSVQILQIGGLVNAFGNGLVVPFLFIYLTDVRGMGRPLAGLIVATNALVALPCGPLSGALSERIGAKRTLCGALVVAAASYASFALVHRPLTAFLAAIGGGVANGAFWPSQAALIARLTPRSQSHTSWGLQRVAMNVGIGLGGVVGGFLATGNEAHGYQLIFLLDAATFLVYLAVLGFVPNPRGDGARRGPGGGYAQVLRDHVLVAVYLTNTVFVTAGIALIELVPAYAKHEAHVTTHAIGLIFLANTLFIGIAQLPVTQLIEGRRRIPLFALAMVIAGLAWFAMPFAARLSGADAALVFAAIAVVFGVGECLHNAIQPPLVVDLAEPRLLERTMALSSSSWMVGFIIGPAVGGLLLKHAPSALWIGAGGVLLVASVATLRLERLLPEGARVTPHSLPLADALAAEALG